MKIPLTFKWRLTIEKEKFWYEFTPIHTDKRLIVYLTKDGWLARRHRRQNLDRFYREFREVGKEVTKAR